MTDGEDGAGGAGRLESVRKIAVLRPNAVGDFVFALPALHALKQAYPDAELVLLGLPWHAAFLHGRPGPVDRVVVVPPLAGVGLGPDADDAAARQAFLAAMQDEGFDIACQMYGGGRYSNPLVAAFGARLTVGARAAGAAPLDRWLPYVEPANRRLALLEIAALAGAAQVTLAHELALTPADREAAAAVLGRAGRTGRAAPRKVALAKAEPFARLAPAASARPLSAPDAPALAAVTAADTAAGTASGTAASGPPLVLLQPGASDPRRCWPAASFAAVGNALAARGARIAVNGTADEAPLVRRVIRALHAPAIDLSGKLGLGGLCGLIDRAACVVSNDSGPLHLALALGTPCVGIFWLTNLIDGAPLRPSLLHAALSLRQECPVCGLPNLRQRCSHDVSFVADVPVEQVVALAREVLSGGQ